jgi:hypothetical protein
MVNFAGISAGIPIEASYLTNTLITETAFLLTSRAQKWVSAGATRWVQPFEHQFATPGLAAAKKTSKQNSNKIGA